MELVQEIHQLLMDREETCHRTCFSLYLDGTMLDNFAELKSVKGLEEGSVLKVRKADISRIRMSMPCFFGCFLVCLCPS